MSWATGTGRWGRHGPGASRSRRAADRGTRVAREAAAVKALGLYLARRTLWTLPTLLLVAITVFVMMRLIPGDPAQLILGDTATPDQVAQLRAEFGLDRPMPVQFWLWLDR